MTESGSRGRRPRRAPGADPRARRQPHRRARARDQRRLPRRLRVRPARDGALSQRPSGTTTAGARPALVFEALAELAADGARRVRRARPDADRRRHLGSGHRRGRDGHADPRPEPRLGRGARRPSSCATRSATPPFTIRVGNDANLAALGELESGALRGVRDGLLIYGNIGIGGAVIVDGAIFPGIDGLRGRDRPHAGAPVRRRAVPLRRPRVPRDARRPGGDRPPGRHPGHAQRDVVAGVARRRARAAAATRR